MGKMVLIHTCFDAKKPFAIPPGVALTFHEKPIGSCGCRRYESDAVRQAMLERGEAYAVAGRNANGGFYSDLKEIVLVDRRRLPIAQTITGRNIESAYGNFDDASDYQQERIKEYGRLEKDAGRAAWSEEVREKVESTGGAR